jgi:transcriptional regulator with XRE-family HTH domain
MYGGLPRAQPGQVSIELAIGAAIEARRLERRMTLGGLAHATNIPQPLLAEYEAGTARAGGSHVLAIADALGMGIGQLFRLHPHCHG